MFITLGWMEAGPGFFSKPYFSGILVEIKPRVHSIVKAGCSPCTVGSLGQGTVPLHGLVASTMSKLPLVGSALGRSIQRKKRCRNPSSSQFLPNWEWWSQGGAKIQAAPSTTLLQDSRESPTPTRPPAVRTSRNEGKTTCIYLFLKFWHILQGWE